MIRILPHMYTPGEQIHVDPGAEQNTNSVNNAWWAQYNGCPRARVSTDPHSGGWSMLYTKDNGTITQGAICWSHRVFGRGMFQMAFWVKGTAGYTFSFGIRTQRASGVGAGGSQTVTNVTLNGSWQFMQAPPFAITQPCQVAAQGYAFGTAPPGTVMNIDDLQLVQVS